jgi:hypothetical protein
MILQVCCFSKNSCTGLMRRFVDVAKKLRGSTAEGFFLRGLFS